MTTSTPPTSTAAAHHPFVALMRRYVVDYLVCRNTLVCAQIMEADYVLRMADAELGPRDEVYVPAVATQLQQFPGMGMTVHELWLSHGEAPDRSDDRLAMLFSQHGASALHNGAVAGWMGIGIYRWNGSRLTSNTALEDYEGRRNQLARTAPVARLPGPALAPWDEQPRARSFTAEAAVRAWTQSPDWMDSPAIRRDSGTGEMLQFEVDRTTISETASAGRSVAFAGVVEGRYRGGLDVPPSCAGMQAVMHVMGLVSVDGGSNSTNIVSGYIVGGRGPLRRALLKASAH